MITELITEEHSIITHGPRSRRETCPIIENVNQHQPIDRRAVDFQGMNVVIHRQPDMLDNTEGIFQILSSPVVVTTLKCITIFCVAVIICITIWCYHCGIMKKLKNVEMKQQMILLQGLVGARD